MLNRHIFILGLTSALAGCSRARVESVPPPASPSVTDDDIAYFHEHTLMVPVDGVDPSTVPDSFNEPRSDGRIHRATDILAPRETPVVAAIAGKVMRLRQTPPAESPRI